MIQLYTWNTPNGKKVSIMAEEVGIPYEVYPINLQQGDQHKPEYLAINPNNKIPSIVDIDGPGVKPLTLFESGAILMYLAEKTGKLCRKTCAKDMK
jgi:GSH-dependent disulfide-bond oxidoreductase